MDCHIESRILAWQPIFLAIGVTIRGSHSFRDAEIAGSFDIYEEELDMPVYLDKFPNHQKGASQWTQSMNHGL